MNKKLMQNQQAFIGMGLACIIMFFAMFIVGLIIVLWLFVFGGLQTIGNMCFLFVIPLFLMVIMAILVKKYLFTGGKK